MNENGINSVKSINDEIQGYKDQFKAQCEGYKDDLIKYESVWTSNTEHVRKNKNDLAKMEIVKDEVRQLIEKENQTIKKYNNMISTEHPYEMTQLDSQLRQIEMEQDDLLYELKTVILNSCLLLKHDRVVILMSHFAYS